MPSSITHELIARETLSLLCKSARELILRAPSYYYLGAQGPDLFFFYRPLARENFGKELHRTRVYDWSCALLHALPGRTGEKFEKCLAYALGFCSHLAADIVFHPTVYRMLSKAQGERFLHQQIENDWDVYFLHALGEGSAVGHRYPFDLKKIGEDGVLSEYLSETAKLYGRDLKRGAIGSMLKAFDAYLRHFHRAHGRILKPFFPELYPREEDAFDLKKDARAEADELFRLAAEESATRICAFLEAFNADMVLPDALFSFHLLTGERVRTG